MNYYTCSCLCIWVIHHRYTDKYGNEHNDIIALCRSKEGAEKICDTLNEWADDIKFCNKVGN